MSKQPVLTEEALKVLVEGLGGEEEASIKVNLPPTIEEFRSGNGEGIWAVPVDSGALSKARSDESVGEQIEVYALNDSVYYPGVVWGSRVVCVTRGDCRPVAVWDALNGTKQATENRE